MDDTTWALVETERRTLTDLLDGLNPGQWEARSLCEEWRVRDVAAHLAMTPAGAPDAWTMIDALVRDRRHLWAAGRDVAIAYARRPTDQITCELRRAAASRTKPALVRADNILLDLLVHGQDIAVPLDLDRRVPPPAGVIALRRTWAMGWPFHSRRRLDGVRLYAEDCDWSARDGPDVTGTSADLLLLMTGRTTIALDRLHGPGVELIKRRTAAATRDRARRQNRADHHDQHRRWRLRAAPACPDVAVDCGHLRVAGHQRGRSPRRRRCARRRCG